MSRAKRTDPESLIKNLKRFAFGQSRSFRDSQSDSFMVEKNFERISTEDMMLIRTALSFYATRDVRASEVDPIDYSFYIAEDTQTQLNDDVPDFALDAYYEAMEEYDDDEEDEDDDEDATCVYEPEYDITSHGFRTEHRINSSSPDDIHTLTTYTIRLNNQPFWSMSSDDFYNQTGQQISIPQPKIAGDTSSNLTYDSVYIPEVIEHERIDDDIKRGVTSIVFEDIVGMLPYRQEPQNILQDYEAEAAKISHILRQLHKNI